ncbi:MAG: hypothetical protein JW850_14150 [Thermoflexales bacterium]|nr:hypothetical protein [Thermoflexales bacterium]
MTLELMPGFIYTYTIDMEHKYAAARNRDFFPSPRLGMQGKKTVSKSYLFEQEQQQ